MTDSTPHFVVPIALIAAMSRNRVIGVEGDLPWHLPEDLRFFKSVTQGKPVVMGRATFESIGRALPNRLNIVVTRRTDFHPEGVQVCNDLHAALNMADDQAMLDGVEEIMVIGGGKIYEQTLPLATRLYLTEVAADIEGDTWFPAFSERIWQPVHRTQGTPAEGQPEYAFVIYERCDG